MGSKGYGYPTQSVTVMWEWCYGRIHLLLRTQYRLPWSTWNIVLASQTTVVAARRRVHSFYTDRISIKNLGSDVIPKSVVDHKRHRSGTCTLRWFNHYQCRRILNQRLFLRIRSRGGRSHGPYADSLPPSSQFQGGGGSKGEGLGLAEGDGGTRTPTYVA